MDNLRIMSNSSVLKPLAVLLTIFFLQQSSGQFAVVFYAVNVFKVRFSGQFKTLFN